MLDVSTRQIHLHRKGLLFIGYIVMLLLLSSYLERTENSRAHNMYDVLCCSHLALSYSWPCKILVWAGLSNLYDGR
jgi:hypothetical protein